MKKSMDPELLAALKLVEEHNLNKPINVLENRLYYNDDGGIRGLWNTDYPAGNYIVLDDTNLFYNSNTQLLRVVGGELKKIERTTNTQTHLIKSTHGQRVVKGIASLALTVDEEYQDVEYYDRKTTN